MIARLRLQTICFPGCAMADTTTQPLKKTALHALHVEYGGKLVEFAGYDMPVQFPTGVARGSSREPNCLVPGRYLFTKIHHFH